jgi:hypothetical protein
MTTVCDGIANEYSKNYNVNCDVMMNVPFYNELSPSEINQKIRLIHHGIAAKGRKLESMIDLMGHLDDRFELSFMLLGMDGEYGQYLREKANDNDKVKFLDPVLSNDVPNFINQFDMGIFLLEPNTFNHKMVLPNKLFQFIQARLGIIIWPSQEMVKIVDKYDVGIYSKDFDLVQIAQKINGLSIKDIQRFKENASVAAKELNSSANEEKLLKIVNDLLS